MMDADVVDTTSLASYLEVGHGPCVQADPQAYPLPAFAISVPHRPSAPSRCPTPLRRATVAAGPSNSHSPPALAPLSPPLSPNWELPMPIWANPRWHKIARGRPLRDCLSSEATRTLLEWLYYRFDKADGNLPSKSGDDSARSATRNSKGVEDGFDSVSEDSVSLDDPMSPEIDLSTRAGVRKWAETVGAPVRPHDMDSGRPCTDTVRPGLKRRTTYHPSWTENEPAPPSKAVSVKNDRLSPTAPCNPASTPAPTTNTRQSRRRTLSLDILFPGQRARRVQLLCSILKDDGGGAATAVVTFISSSPRLPRKDSGILRRRRATRSTMSSAGSGVFEVDTVAKKIFPPKYGLDDERPHPPRHFPDASPLPSPKSEGRPMPFTFGLTDLTIRRASVPAAFLSNNKKVEERKLPQEWLRSGNRNGSDGIRELLPPPSLSPTHGLQLSSAQALPPVQPPYSTVHPDLTPGQPIFISGDGKVKNAPTGSMPSPSRDPLAVANLLLNKDWSKTPLGQLDTWPTSLRTVVSMLSVFPLPTAVWWGKDLSLLYNEAYSQSTTQHPQLFGIYGKDSMQHLRSSLGEFTGAVLSGVSIYKDDEFHLRRDSEGAMREAYRSLLWAPIKNEKGNFGGIWHATRDTTPKVIADRRTTLIRELSSSVSSTRTMHDFERGTLETLDAHPKDAPFAMLYFVEEHAGGGLNQDAAEPRSVRLRFAGAVGMPLDHFSAPEVIMTTLPGTMPQVSPGQAPSLPSVLSSDRSTIHGGSTPQSHPSIGSPALSYASTFDSVTASADPGWNISEALSLRQTVLVDCEHLVREYELRDSEFAPVQAVVVPISLKSDDGLPTAVMVLGVSPRNAYDEQYKVFIEDLRFSMASYLSAVRSYAADRRRLGELATLDSARSLLFSNVSHELLVPLTLIAGPLDDAIIDMQDGTGKNSLVLARRNVSRLSRLVSMLVDISNLESGQLRGSFARVNLGAITRDVAGQFAKAVAKTSLQYTVVCDERPRNVFVDRERWEKILFSLIENALKYTTEGFVKVSLQYSHKQAILTVSDSGIGIASATVDELNKGFFGSRTFTSVAGVTVAGSSSISFTFAKKLIQLHGGDFEIESRTEMESVDGIHGTTIRIHIPLGCAHLPPDAIAATPQQVPSTPARQSGREVIEESFLWHTDRDREDVESSSGSTSNSSQDTKKCRGIDGALLNFSPQDVVMIVDDMPDAQRYMRNIFEPFCKVVVARNGREALAKYEAAKPDLIISDTMLPQMNGIQLLAALRSGTREQKLVPVILLAAAEDIQTSLVKADDYLYKPFNARRLIARANMQLQMGKERRSLEQLFDERTQELRLLSDHSLAAILRCDKTGKLIYTNLVWQEMTGVPPGMDPLMHEYLHESNAATVLEKWTKFIHSDEALIKLDVMWKNGRWISFKLARLDQKVAGKGGFIGSAIDITEAMINETLQRQRIVEAEARRAEAEEARKQQELLIDITSHEIRNPISNAPPANPHCSSMVRTNLRLLMEELEFVVNARAPVGKPAFHPTKQLLVSLADDIEALDSIYQCGLAQERISNDVLSLGKMQLDLLQMFDVETSVPSVARKVLSIFENEARMNRITLKIHISDSFEKIGVDRVMTDPVRLSQIITNLLSNAIRFTANSQERRIDLTVEASLVPPQEGTCLAQAPGPQPTRLKPGTPVYIYMSVNDTGPGLTPTELQKLFQRFSQASPMTHTVFGGSGLGLFVCRKLAERMGGEIEVASEYGRGSQFRFYIRTSWPGRSGSTGSGAPKNSALLGAPMTPSVSSQSGRSGGGHGRGRSSGSNSPAPARKLRILIVEDNMINRTVLLRQLKHVGTLVDSAANGLEALKKVEEAMAPGGEQLPFDCVLMDLEMPVMDGYTATRRIREEEAQGKLAPSIIVALTGNARQAQIREGMADFDAAVIKPYRLNDLISTIEELIDGKSKAAREKKARLE